MGFGVGSNGTAEQRIFHPKLMTTSEADSKQQAIGRKLAMLFYETETLRGIIPASVKAENDFAIATMMFSAGYGSYSVTKCDSRATNSCSSCRTMLLLCP
jgi:hypothetical protein